MKRVLAVLAPAALVLGLAGCMGADDDDDESPTTEAVGTTPEDVDITLPEITIPEITIPDFTIPDITIPDFTIPDFTIPDISIPDLSDLSVPENAEELIAEAFPNLDEEQLDCLIENLQGDFDPQEALNLMETCDIQPGDLIGG